MKKKTLFFTSILGAAILSSVFTMTVTAEQGAFTTSKTDRSLIKDLVVGQKEIKATLQQVVSACKK